MREKNNPLPTRLVKRKTAGIASKMTEVFLKMNEGSAARHSAEVVEVCDQHAKWEAPRLSRFRDISWKKFPLRQLLYRI